ncbi:hypothetical protein F5141DRAFT_1200324 [Pisolithus sp. B1]|nr:hypothetical protein F5141DRAFT_1200324 [Pisolithus sp. B1]
MCETYFDVLDRQPRSRPGSPLIEEDVRDLQESFANLRRICVHVRDEESSTWLMRSINAFGNALIRLVLAFIWDIRLRAFRVGSSGFSGLRYDECARFLGPPRCGSMPPLINANGYGKFFDQSYCWNSGATHGSCMVLEGTRWRGDVSFLVDNGDLDTSEAIIPLWSVIFDLTVLGIVGTIEIVTPGYLLAWMRSCPWLGRAGSDGGSDDERAWGPWGVEDRMQGVEGQAPGLTIGLVYA